MKYPATKKGSISLEAALSVPLVLFLLVGLVGEIKATHTRIRLAGALQRTASEISLVLPAFSLLALAADGENAAGLPFLQDAQTLLATIDDSSFVQLTGLNPALDLATSTTLAPLVLGRIDTWLDQLDRRNEANNIFSKKAVFLEWQPERRVMWINLQCQMNTLWGKRTIRQKAAVPLWVDLNLNKTRTANEDDKLWELDNFSRGRKIRDLMGGNLPATFPVIASFSNGRATMIKSMDLTAPSYQQGAVLVDVVNGHLSRLAAFSGASYKYKDTVTNIAGGDITERQLLLVIPENSEQAWLEDALREIENLACTLNCTFTLVRLGVSRRYSSPDQNEPQTGD